MLPNTGHNTLGVIGATKIRSHMLSPGSPLPPLHACRNFVFAVAALHNIGCRRLRMMPYWDSGSWTALLGDESMFEFENGAFVALPNRPNCLRIEPATVTWQELFVPFEPWRIAEVLVDQYPALRRKDMFTRPPTPIPESRDVYIHWQKTLVAHMAVHPSALPSLLPDAPANIWIHYLAPDARNPIRSVETFSAPPTGLFDSAATEKSRMEFAIAAPRDSDAPSLLWPTSPRTGSELDAWYEDNAPGDREK